MIRIGLGGEGITEEPGDRRVVGFSLEELLDRVNRGLTGGKLGPKAVTLTELGRPVGGYDGFDGLIKNVPLRPSGSEGGSEPEPGGDASDHAGDSYDLGSQVLAFF
jgi:hypothetical protein